MAAAQHHRMITPMGSQTTSVTVHNMTTQNLLTANGGVDNHYGVTCNCFNY